MFTDPMNPMDPFYTPEDPIESVQTCPGPNRICYQMFTDPMDPMDLIYTTDGTINYDIACRGPNGPCLFH